MAWPAGENRVQNPYHADLYSAVAERGAVVEPFSISRLALLPPDLLHVHWPEYVYAGRGRLGAVVRVVAFLSVVSAARLRRCRVVWTVHNLAGHEPTYALLERFFWSWFVQVVDGSIHLSKAAAAEALVDFPQLSRRPHEVIVHGRYDVPSDGGPEVLREDRGTKLLIFGNLRNYKGIQEFADLYRRAPRERPLLIAGMPFSEKIRRDLVATSEPGRVELDLRFVPDLEIRDVFRGASVTVVPYPQPFNSGVAMLALSLGCPVVANRSPTMEELQETVGANWVHLVDFSEFETALEDTMRWLGARQSASGPDLSSFAWSSIADKHLAFYEKLLGW